MSTGTILPKDLNWNEMEKLSRIYNYNDYFHPGVCHICKKPKYGLLIPCTECHLIFYCGEKHEADHLKQHREFCTFITENYSEEIRQVSRPVSADEWFQNRQNLLLAVETDFPNLSSYETQMIIFAKSCYFCHRQNELSTCVKCYSYYYCVDCYHKPEFSNHTLKCDEFKLCLMLNILNLKDFAKRKFANHYLYIHPDIYIENMESFILKYVRPLKRTQEWSLWSENEYIYSDYISDPLTLYDSMKKAKLISFLEAGECIVHIISATPLESKYMRAWQILLHLIDSINSLIIVLIGPQLEDDVFEESIDIVQRHPGSSRDAKVKLRIECHRMTYSEYDSKYPSQPKVVIMYQADFYIFQSLWSVNVPVIRRKNCPFVLTAASGDIANECKTNLQKLGTMDCVSPEYMEPNPFKSFIPQRLWHTDDVGWRNSHVIIYKNLKQEVMLKKAVSEDPQPSSPSPKKKKIDPQPSTSWAHP